MKTPRHQVTQILGNQLMKHPVKQAVLSQEIASYLLAEGRTADLEPLLRDIVAFRAQHGIIEVSAISAHQLSAKDHTDIKQLAHSLHPKATSIIINTQLDPDLIGGVRLEIVAQKLDLSIRTKLNHMKQLTTAERMT